MSRLLLALLLFLPGCLLAHPDTVFPGDDDDATGDDDDATGDDDDATGDDDDSTEPDLPPCEHDDSLPGSQDGDGDGWPAWSIGDAVCDCDDQAPTVHPGGAEVFDLVPNDCDAQEEFEDLSALEGEWLQPGSIVDDSFESDLGAHVSVGDLNDDGFADLCVRSRETVYVLMDYVGAFWTENHLDAGELITIVGLHENGSVDCSTNIDATGGTDVVINHFPTPNGGSGGGTLSGGGGLLVFAGDDVADGLSFEQEDALVTWPMAGDTTSIAWRGLCLGTGDFAAAAGQEIVTGVLPAVNPNGDVVFRVLSYESTTGNPTLFVRGSQEISSFEEPFDVDCFALGDLDNGGQDDVILNGGLGAELWFSEEFGGGAAAGFYGVEITSASSGDFTGDGTADLVLGASWWDEGDQLYGAAMVPGGIDPSLWQEVPGFDTAVNPAYGVNFYDDRAASLFGAAVCNVGDVDGDGSDELLVTAPGAVSEVGEARLYRGRSWEAWLAEAKGDNGMYARGTETTRFTGSVVDGGFGWMGACDSAVPRNNQDAPWPLIGEPWGSATGGASRLWTWESFPDGSEPGSN